MCTSLRRRSRHSGRAGFAVAVVAAVFASTACTHTPDGNNFRDGKEFVGEYTVENVVQDDDDPDPPLEFGFFRAASINDELREVLRRDPVSSACSAAP